VTRSASRAAHTGLPGQGPAAGLLEVRLPGGGLLRVLTAGQTLRLGRRHDQDLVLAPKKWTSRAQAELIAGDGYAVLRRRARAQGAMWTQRGPDVRAVGRGVPVLLLPGATLVRMHTDRSIHPITHRVLDPHGAPVLQVHVGAAVPAADPDDITEGPTPLPPDDVRCQAGYATLVALCAPLLRHGDGAALPEAAELAQTLDGVGTPRAEGTCRNDLTRMADRLGLREDRVGNVSRYQLARAAVDAGWVTLDDIDNAGLP
jgi:hypothetical protein